MRQSYKDKTFCQIDLGLFPEMARTLALGGVGSMLYWSPWEDGFPSLYKMKIGDGFEGVTRIEDPFSVFDEVDLFIFSDNAFGGMQDHFERLGKRVWGPRFGGAIEDDKEGFEETCKEIGVPVCHREMATGITDLRKKLKNKKDVWIKVSLIRGNFETFHVDELRFAESNLEKIAHDLGPWKEKQKFIIEDTFPDSVEIAYDLWQVRGKFPKKALFGLEKKGDLYCCHTMDYAELPAQIQDLNSRFAPVLEEYGAISNFPVEIRVNKKGEYVALDPCMREGHPVLSTKLLMIKNLPDVFWFGAEGECLDPEFEIENAWGAELVISSAWVETDPKAVFVPKDLRNQVKLRYAAEVDGVPWVLPQTNAGGTLGSIVATNKSFEKCKAEMEDIEGKIRGGSVDTFPDAFHKFTKNWEKLQEFGIKNLPKIN